LAEAVRDCVINQSNENRPRTHAMVSQLVDRHLEHLDVDVATQKRYEIAIWTHIEPLLGMHPISKTSTPSTRCYVLEEGQRTAPATESSRAFPGMAYARTSRSRRA
jgi:hypothetical protein